MAGRPCTVCSHPSRSQLDGLIVEGVSHREIARTFDLNNVAVSRHAKSHLPDKLVQATQAAEVFSADSLLGEIRSQKQRLHDLGAKAEQDGDIRTAITGVGQWSRLAELGAKVAGQLDERAVVNVTLSPEWALVRSALLDALRPFPEARVAVADALSRVEGPGGHP